MRNNILIAKFMGKTPEDGIGWSQDYIDYRFKESLKYNKSWDHLMPVVIKMASMKDYEKFNNRSRGNWFYMEGNPISSFTTTEDLDVNLTLDILYKEVVEFIKWYNKQNK